MKKLLIYIDDSEADRLIMNIAFETLKRPDCELKAFASGEDFLCFLKFEGSYQERNEVNGQIAILLDINLPGLNGFQILENLKRKENSDISSIPVILFSSSRREMDMRVGSELGAHSFITKPLDFYELAGIITHVFDDVIVHQNNISV